MDARVHTAQEGGGVVLASFGSGDSASRGGRPGVRARGRSGRQVAPAGAHRNVLARARRGAAAPGRGRAARRQALEEIQAAARRGRGPARLTNAQVAQFHARLRALNA